MSHVVVSLVLLALGTSPVPDAALPTSLDLTTIRALPVQHDGRWTPLDTVARDVVESITGDAFHQGRDPVLLLLAWAFDGPAWMDQPLIKIGNAQLRRELHLPASQTVFSYRELAGHDHFLSLIDELAHVERGRKMNPLEAKVADINEKLMSLQHAVGGRVIRPIPDHTDIGGAWHPITPLPSAGADTPTAVKDAWEELKQAFLADDASAFTAASQELTKALAELPAAYRPAPELITTELRYNRMNAFRLAWQLMVVGAVLATAAMLVRRKWFDGLALVGTIAGFAVLTYGLSLRWQIAGRIPASNMFESLLFLSWGMGAFAIVSMLFLRHRLVPLTASVMGAIALMLADLLPMDHYIRPIVPVLRDTVWMSIHVPIIMVSYSVLALGVLIAHVQLVVMAAVPGRRKLINTVDSLHYWYIHVGTILLLAGIVTGSMWAASSWGRYWGWDPKEVWSLVALLGYLAILHMRIDPGRTPLWAHLGGLFSMEGRYNRARYFWRMLAIAVVGNVLAFEVARTFGASGVATAHQWVVSIAIAAIGAYLVVKRLHDLDRPGTHYWLFLVPIYNIYLGAVVLLFRKGTDGPNKYGPEPLPGKADGKAVATLICIAVLYVVVAKLGPLTGGKVLALSGMLVGVAFFLLARGMLAMAFKSVLCFWLIIMTYVGVNYVLGIGLHTYGFGTGAVVRYMFLIGGIDLAFVVLCCVIYLARRRWRAPVAPDLPAVACG